ncbi:immunoglobulin-like domain-containing protein [Stigmatella hybrida]|uniref:immunoglobulin-like domain-containing protein n=1 Tax=Stigmatella hybrida TaxID=394097 RepID=UPI001CDA973E|nr:immunoglobulin-like domain-containing protein [Stigmatella hybrida]
MIRVLSERIGVVTALALVACGTETAPPPPPRETAHHRTGLQTQCVQLPPTTPSFQPELKWEWTGTAEFRQVMSTPVVVDVNQDGTPDIVFNAFTGSNSQTGGVLRALNGATGQELWTVTDTRYRVRGSAQIAAGDIDHDGKVELCTVPEGDVGLLCFEHDGTFKFRTSASTNTWGGPSFADLDGDGSVEILNGNHVFSATGELKWVGSDGTGGPGTFGPLSFAVDLDGDGFQEVINGRAIYEHDGQLRCVHPSLGQGLAAVGNFDADPAGEVVIVSGGTVALMDSHCTPKWRVSLQGGGAGGAPAIADVDGDGQPEIGVAGSTRFTVIETDGTVKWASPIQGTSSGVGSSVAFDFDGDGKAEFVHADQTRLRIYDGTSGAARITPLTHSSGSAYENPIIVDVDGDNRAELVVPSNNYLTSGVAGIRVYREKTGVWVNTRRIWNQHAYSVTHVNPDGTLPSHPAAPWLVPGLNTFRANTQGNGVSPFALPDLTVTALTVGCAHTGAPPQLVATVRNQGDASAPEGVPIAFHQGDAATGGSLLGVATLQAPLPAGQSVEVRLAAELNTQSLPYFVQADANAAGTGTVTECREDNNSLSQELTLSCGTANVPPEAVCKNVTLPAAATTCKATYSAASTPIDNASYDPDHGPQPLTLRYVPAEGVLGLGSHDITLTVSDGLDSDQCTGTLTVVDVTPPTLNANLSYVQLNCGEALPQDATAHDACQGDLTSRIELVGFNSMRPHSEITYRVTDDAGNTATAPGTRPVDVTDETLPTVTLRGEAEMTLECDSSATYVDPGAIGADECEGALTVKVFNSGQGGSTGPNLGALGTYDVQYQVNDSWGHYAEAIRTVMVKDTTPPVLTLNGPAQVTLTAGTVFQDPGASATDRCFGNLNMAVVRTGTLNTDVPGTYLLTYTVQDSATPTPFTAQVRRTVTVVSAQQKASRTAQR